MLAVSSPTRRGRRGGAGRRLCHLIPAWTTCSGDDRRGTEQETAALLAGTGTGLLVAGWQHGTDALVLTTVRSLSYNQTHSIKCVWFR